MNKNEQAYRLKCEGMTNSEIASIVGVDRKTVPTIAKAYRDAHGLPDWRDAAPAMVADSKKPKADIDESRPVDALISARMLLEKMKDTDDPVLITLIGDIARISSGIVRAQK